MAQAVTRETLGAWLLKANPTVWDVRRFRADGHTRLTSWSVQRGYRASLMGPGDKVVFWLSGPGKGDLVRGVWGLGHVVAEPQEWQDTERGWWLDDAARQSLRARVEVDVPLLGHPLPASEAPCGGDHRPRGPARTADVEPVLGRPRAARPAGRPAPSLATTPPRGSRRGQTVTGFALVHGAGDVGWCWHLVEAELGAGGT